MSIPFNLGIRAGKMKWEMEGRQVERCYETMFIPSPLSFSFACFLRCGILCIKDAIPRTATLYATSVKYGCSFHPLYWLAFAILSLHTSTGKPRWFQRISLALSACLWMHGYVYVGMGVCVCGFMRMCACESLALKVFRLRNKMQFRTVYATLLPPLQHKHQCTCACNDDRPWGHLPPSAKQNF